MPSGLIAENLYVPLLLASVAVVLRFRDRPGLWLALGAGLLLGASAMTRTNGLIVLLPLAAGVWLARRRWADIGILVAGVVIALTPWTVRNLAAFGDFAPLGTQTGVVLIGVFNEEARGSEFYGIFRPPEKVPEVAEYVHAPGHTETELDAKFRSKALGFALDHPGYTISITVRHALQLVELRNTLLTGGTSHREQSIPLGFARDTNRGGFLLLALLAIAGAVLARRLWWRRELLWFWSIPVLLFVSVVVVQGSPRYRLPIDPFLCLLAAAVPLSLLDRLRRRPSS
jgi:4-amino-4-deoxy-L-arabinose transferase-like glycosyltransferase